MKIRFQSSSAPDLLHGVDSGGDSLRLQYYDIYRLLAFTQSLTANGAHRTRTTTAPAVEMLFFDILPRHTDFFDEYFITDSGSRR